MKLPKERILIFVFAFLVTIMGANVTQASANVDVAFSFHDALAPYGSWVQVSSYGNCWRPRVSAGFIPYSNGHWEYTSYGPTWVGYEPWAWCAYHYGQWVFTPEFGWVWQPGYSYTPGRVVWATGPDYIGWTPYVAGGGPNVNFWVVVNRDRFGYSNYSNYVLRRDVVRNMFDNRVVRVHSGTLDRAEVERITHRPIHVVPVDVRQVSADHRSVKLIVPRGHETTVLREISHAQQNSQSSAKAVTSKKVTTTQVNRFASSKQHSEVKPATNFKASSSSTNKHVSTHQMEPKKVESKKVEPKKHTEISPKSKQYVPQVSKHTEVSTKSMHPVSQVPNGGQKERFNSKEKPHANVAVDSKHVDSKHVDSKQNGKATKSKQSESHKKSKPPQSH